MIIIMTVCSSITLGKRPVVVLSDYKSVRDAFFQNAFLDRPPNPPNDVILGTKSFASSSGEAWKEQRKFALQVLRDVGYGKSRMEEFMKVYSNEMFQEEVNFLLNVFMEYEGKPVPIRRYLAPSTSNNISSLVFGKRLDYDLPQRVILDSAIHKILQFFKPTAIHAYFPMLKTTIYYLGFWGYDKLQTAIVKMMEFVDEEIAHHKETLDPSNVRDYIDGYLLQMEQRKDNPHTSFTMPMLRGNLPSLFGAGSSTVRATLEWLLLTLVKFPEVQERCRAELDDVVGRARQPCWVDHTSLPYIEAVLMEIQRWKTVVPLNLVRYAMEDAYVQNFFIPKGTAVLASIWDVHHDPEVFNKPEEFIPERFLSKDGTQVVKSEAYMPFTVGKRACLGEQFAIVELFLYFTSILQKFEICAPPGYEPDMNGQIGVVNEPVPYELCLKPRDV
ncbi:hypothetical protein LAZ67_4003333 [Cordylochernes scorpioides]|uniref:Uncharacterized protein n=1 Tax=Cordylochernes scorpioides TaxID=51811 RepID=A0ABY6KGZ7_9ARAC|nr:hypothetical protein LAZ67_4003333 [Cordylochernes scorpioides]